MVVIDDEYVPITKLTNDQLEKYSMSDVVIGVSFSQFWMEGESASRIITTYMHEIGVHLEAAAELLKEKIGEEGLTLEGFYDWWVVQGNNEKYADNEHKQLANSKATSYEKMVQEMMNYYKDKYINFKMSTEESEANMNNERKSYVITIVNLMKKAWKKKLKTTQITKQ